MSELCKSCDRKCGHSFVYIMGGRSDGALKIGYAKDAKKRAYQLRREFGEPVVLMKRYRVRCEFTAMEVEDAAHLSLRQHWTGRGEWFACSFEVADDAILTAIRRVS